jgi:hypothetical protein
VSRRHAAEKDRETARFGDGGGGSNEEANEEEMRVRRILVAQLVEATVHYLDALHAIGAHREMAAVAKYSRKLPARLCAVHALKDDPHSRDTEGQRRWPAAMRWHRRLPEHLAAVEWLVAYRRGASHTEPPQGRPAFSTTTTTMTTAMCSADRLDGAAEPCGDRGPGVFSPILESVTAAFARLDRTRTLDR